MSRFVAVFHQWHVKSRGFDVLELAGSDRDQANAQAAVELRSRDGFYRADYVLVEIGSAESLPRRLTWRERITGRLSLK